MKHQQIVTRWKDSEQDRLVTSLEEAELPELGPGEILIEVLFVPLHGSFWLASHPDAIHPRKDEFLSKGQFVFGNGGVGRVVQSKEDERVVGTGDYVCVFGHVPCSNYDCYACTVLHRYTECEYGESVIIGHGKNSTDGTYARYAVLPRYSYEVCYRETEKPLKAEVMPFMFGFLVADVRNALTRHPDSLRMRRMLLVGAGFSGQIAAYLHNRTCPESRILVIDSSQERLDTIKAIDPDSIQTLCLPAKVSDELNGKHQSVEFRQELCDVIELIRDTMMDHFDGRTCNLLFDSSSGNTTPLWDNSKILGPATHCIPFGFGSQYILLNSSLMQRSGLNILMSRGVGNIRNRKEVIELIKAGASSFVMKSLVETAKECEGLDEAMEFIQSMHNPPKSLREIPHCYISENQLED